MTSVSVAMATYNGGRFVAEQLQSILDQTLPPLEVVVSDDGSTDDTLDVIRRVAAAHPGPTVVRILDDAGHLGVSGNFARAVEATTGEYIALSDQDDRWHPDRLSRTVELLDANPDVLLLHGDADLVDADGMHLGSTLLTSLRLSDAERALIDAGRGFAAYIRRNLATGATVTFRRSLLASALPFPAAWVHDEWLAAIAAAVGSTALDPRPLIDYRQHGANEIGVDAPTLRYRIGRMVERRGDRYVELAARSALLSERLEQLGAPTEWRELAAAKARFEAVRATYPSIPMARLPRVLGELRRGSYRQLSSQGTLDVIRDLVQPA